MKAYILIASTMRDGNTTYSVGKIFKSKDEAEMQKRVLNASGDIYTIWHVVEREYINK